MRRRDLKLKKISPSSLIINEENILFMARIWQQYALAMKRRRPEGVLPLYPWLRYTMCSQVEGYTLGSSFVFGARRNGIFIPTHFAPKTDREGYLLVKALKGEKVAFFVTPDLGKMLKKLGYKKLPCQVKATFRGETVKKEIYVSSWKVVPTILSLIGQDTAPVYDEDRSEDLWEESFYLDLASINDEIFPPEDDEIWRED